MHFTPNKLRVSQFFYSNVCYKKFRYLTNKNQPFLSQHQRVLVLVFNPTSYICGNSDLKQVLKWFTLWTANYRYAAISL